MRKTDYKVSPIKYSETKVWLLKIHYAHRMPNVKYSFGLYDKTNTLIGVCTYGLSPSIEIRYCCGDKYKDNVIELNRVIKVDGLERNLQSYFISQTFLYLPKPTIIISYADPNHGHHGYTYQALNFLYTGLSSKKNEYRYQNKQYTERHINMTWFTNRNLPFDVEKSINNNWLDIGGSIIDLLPKYRYMYFLGSKGQKKLMRKNLQYKVKPYPKGDNQRYDTKHKHDVQLKLF